MEDQRKERRMERNIAQFLQTAEGKAYAEHPV